MAVADSLTSTSMRINPVKMGMIQAEARAKQKQKESLDASLLCSKLEEFKREQDAHRLRKEKRDAVRNGYYVPRTAAKQFAATATPAMDQNFATRKHYAKPLQPIHEPKTSDGSMCISPERLGHASSIPVARSDDAARVERRKSQKDDEQEKRDSMNPLPSENRSREDPARKPLPRSRPIAVIIPERRSSSQLGTSPDSIVKLSEEDEETEERGRSRQPRPVHLKAADYKPGDAALRRSMVEIFPHGKSAFPIPDDHTAEPPHRPISFYAIQDLRQARSILENELHHDLGTVTEDPESKSSFSQQYRPRPAPDDRPDWSQQSQTPSDMRHTLNLFSSRRPHTEGGGGGEKSLWSKSTIVTKPRSRTPQGNPSGDHMIADAVKIIQRQERLRKRQSVLGFFKRL